MSHFFCGTVPDKDHLCYFGLGYFHRDNFYKIGGFNENFIGWGGEDIDFYDRLEKIGIERSVILNIKDFVYHIPHDENLKVVNHKDKNTKFSIEYNKVVGSKQNDFIMSKYELLSADDKVTTLRRVKN